MVKAVVAIFFGISEFVKSAGYVPDFHKITSLGMDTAAIVGDWSLRAEASYTIDRFFNTRQELWGYLPVPGPGEFPLLPNQPRSDTIAYGIGTDYRIVEDMLLTMQAQQTVIIDRPPAVVVAAFRTVHKTGGDPYLSGLFGKRL